MNLLIQNAQFQLKERSFKIAHFSISSDDYWTIIGANGSGKSLLANILQNDVRNSPLVMGGYTNQFSRIARLSFEHQQKILEAIFNSRNNDCVSPDDFGLTVRQIIGNWSEKTGFIAEIVEQLGIGSLLDRPFMQLSTGESRKVLLCQILASQPDLLILDEPFEGLDQESVQDWRALLSQLKQKMAIVLIVNRLTDIPVEVTHLAILDNLQLVAQGLREDVEQQPLFQQLLYAESAENMPLPESIAPLNLVYSSCNPFELRNVTVQYGDKKILNNLSWTVEPQQHWWIKGPNGAGKSTLLSLITGDHPQAYANHVLLFGKQRGSGETIWEIKRHIGYVSSQLHMDYRVNCAALDVVISGFFDSIGVYRQVPMAVRLKAMEWLQRLGFAHLAHKSFRALSWGQQRLLLITRAMVKHPPIFILDEPLQGLDGLNRKLVKDFIEQLVQHSRTQLLFVSHQGDDAPNCITHLFEFIRENDGYVYQQRAIK